MLFRSETDMTAVLKEDYRAKALEQIPLGRLAEPQEVARVVGFLAAQDSSYITGSNISINGGQHMF